MVMAEVLAMRVSRYFSQPLKSGARVMVNRPRHGDVLFEICRCTSAAKAEEIAQDVLPLALP